MVKITMPWKLVDAYYAATTCSGNCTLILAQGDFAETFAMCGLSVVGQNYYGIYTVDEGKLLNVREASNEELHRNADFQNIKKILGLQDDKIYQNLKELRYGHVMFMADQDQKGSQFKGLLINFLHFFWPSLLKIPNFMLDFIPPIVKASTKKTAMKNLEFFSMAEYEAWKKNLENKAPEYKIKYRKGLASNNPEEVEEYFADLNHYTKEFVWYDDEDGDAIEIAFDKMKIIETKDWLQAHQAGHSKEKHIRYRDFINRELIVFSNQISIPSIVDGLNLRTRKILFCAFKKPITEKIQLSKFSHYVYVYSRYHDNVSLVEPIIGMAQNYVGSNNINLLQPIGHFGTRLMGGKDHSRARDIFTQLSPITRYIFHKSDEHLLNYLNDDGRSVEPAWFIPIIPMVLVNGCEGIGSAWSSFIPKYNPRDIIANLKHLLNGEEMVPMIPWYKGYKGVIQKEKSGYTTRGIIEEIEGKNALKITELPIGMFTRQYEEFLHAAIEDGKDNTPFIKDHTACNDAENINFEITMTEDQMKTAKKEGLWKKFELTTRLSTGNMHLFDEHGVIKKYDTPEQILEEFFNIRLRYYEKRMTAQLCKLEKALKALKLLKNKEKFVRLVYDREIDLFNIDYVLLLNELEKNGLEKETEVEEEVAAGEEKPQGNASEMDPGTGYHYLLSMKIGSFFTKKKIEELKHKKNDKQKEVDALKILNPRSLWLSELVALEEQLQILDGNYISAKSNPEIAKEAPKKKEPAKRTASGSLPQRANKKRF